MGDVGEMYRAWDEHKRALKQECPGCPKVRPKAHPTKLLPGQRCKVCGHVDKRTKNNQEGAQ